MPGSLRRTPSRAPLGPLASRNFVNSCGRSMSPRRPAGSSGSGPAIAPSRIATSLTVRPIGPAVSCEAEIGTIPERLTSPTVGFSPARPQLFDGETIDPSVSVPTPTAHRLAATAAPVPELDPEQLRSSAYGFRVSPPRPLQPLVDVLDRKLAHSLRFVLPRITAPASRSR